MVHASPVSFEQSHLPDVDKALQGLVAVAAQEPALPLTCPCLLGSPSGVFLSSLYIHKT